MPKSKTKYVDGFVLVVPKKHIAEYRKMAREGCNIWMKYGALSYRECMLEDSQVKVVPLPFPKMIKAKPSETVWFSYIEYKSKTHRNAVNKKVMQEMDEKYKDEDMDDMPFDMKRMSVGGFTVEVSS